MSVEALKVDLIKRIVEVEQLAKEQGYDPKKLWEAFTNIDLKNWEDKNISELMEILREK